MPIFQLKQKFLSITERFEIKNENDQVVYLVDGKFFSIGKTFHLTSPDGVELAEIKQKLFSFRPTFNITFVDGRSAQLVKTFLPLFKSRFLISYAGRKLEVSGNFLSHEYQFREASSIVAQVSKKWFSFSDTYGLDVEDETLSQISLCILIAIDAIHHGRDNE
ncbi:hypothetical protein A9Q98_11615 [Thalassotalea sp. 42_200_T64]|nr:hypothetical protein A9Q98_11615 [Thalassotalea sp. 42_200_T64]